MKPRNKISSTGHTMLTWVQDLGLIIIALSTVVALIIEIKVMWDNGTVMLADLLLMFIYLEIFAMVSIYLDSGKLPVRMPIYIAIVALARYLILDMKGMDAWKVVAIAVASLILALTVLVIRYGHLKYPYDEPPEAGG
ncbi:MAG: phosphate-starvation-inducible PsiE family protein [Xanthomonadales bacterium]|nr:phosphate-starvation-inducible PsiE family protein [Gammaproteobacteria bacterium]MBT8056160.1 phosphate-starvation-inducible PsiE family protein [Gammaproteobacteria bacterium]NNL05482.1 phosphate-starvation-inducible PsiE family protein [Xanthomonadales bacterium]